MSSVRPKFHPQARELVAHLVVLFDDPLNFQTRDPLGALIAGKAVVSPLHPLATSWSLHGAIAMMSQQLFGHANWKLGLLHDLEAALDRIAREMDPKEVTLMGWASRSWRTHTDILELLARLQMELAEDVPLPFNEPDTNIAA